MTLQPPRWPVDPGEPPSTMGPKRAKDCSVCGQPVGEKSITCKECGDMYHPACEHACGSDSYPGVPDLKKMRNDNELVMSKYRKLVPNRGHCPVEEQPFVGSWATTGPKKIISPGEPKPLPSSTGQDVLMKLAKQHYQYLRGPMRGRAPNDADLVLRGIPGGGAFTGKRDDSGNLRDDLRPDEAEALHRKTITLCEWAERLLQACRPDDVPVHLYRIINVADPHALIELRPDFVPSSTSWKFLFDQKWYIEETGIVLQLEMTSHFPFIAFSYPRDPDPNWEPHFNQDQQEVIIVPSRYEIIERQLIGKYRVWKVKPTPISREDLDDFYGTEIERIKPKPSAVECFSADQVKEKFSSAAAEAILLQDQDKYVERTLQFGGQDGQNWTLVRIDRDFDEFIFEKEPQTSAEQ